MGGQRSLVVWFSFDEFAFAVVDPSEVVQRGRQDGVGPSGILLIDGKRLLV